MERAVCLLQVALVALCLLPICSDAQEPAAKKVEKPIPFVVAKPDPNIGDWQGEGGLVAQVFTVKGEYHANLLTAFDTENNFIATLSGAASADGLDFTGEGWTASIKSSHFTGSGNGKKFDLQHIVRQSPTLGEKPPPGAIVLFDGNNMEAWAKKAGKNWLTEDGPSKWKLADGAMEIVPGSDCIITHQKFGDCHLHVEFRDVCSPTKSAVFLETRYEVNINDSYGKQDGASCGGLDNTFKNFRPKVHPALPPLAWQTFDIDFTAPRFDAAGQKTAKAAITVLLNGVKMCDHQELDAPFGAAGRLSEAPTGPLMLQDHTTPAQFRNIWLVQK